MKSLIIVSISNNPKLLARSVKSVTKACNQLVEHPKYRYIKVCYSIVLDTRKINNISKYPKLTNYIKHTISKYGLLATTETLQGRASLRQYALTEGLRLLSTKTIDNNPLVLFLDGDMILSRNILIYTLNKLQQHENNNIGGYFPSYPNLKKNSNRLVVITKYIYAYMLYLKAVLISSMKRNSLLNRLIPLYAPSLDSAFFIISHELYKLSGGFVNFFQDGAWGGEDVDLGRRLYLLNAKIHVLNPFFRVYHQFHHSVTKSEKNLANKKYKQYLYDVSISQHT